MSVLLDIRLKKPSKIYREGESVSGIVVISCSTETRHEGVNLTIDGIVNLELSSKCIGQYESFYNSVKPIQLVLNTFAICKGSGKFPHGTTEIPFMFTLQGSQTKVLYETYHGVFINIQYFIKVDMKRGLLAKDLEKSCEFIVESSGKMAEKATAKPIDFVIVPESVHKLKSKYNVPNFKITGKIDSLVCSISNPFTGEITIESCDEKIKSIEVQLVRIETCGCADGYSKDATEIQNIQIGDGDVVRKIPIPIYMVFPRLFTCPTLSTANFKLEFEVNISVVFEDNHLVSENFPIYITRF